MAGFLSDAWLDELAARGASCPEVAGASIVCQHEITGAPDGTVRFYAVWRDGRLVEVVRGRHASPDCLVTAKAADALAVLSGTTETEVAFMQGRLKIDGDYRRLLVDLHRWRTSPPIEQLRREMAELTDA